MCLTGDDGGGGDGLAGSVACVCVGADRLTEADSDELVEAREGGGSIGGDDSGGGGEVTEVSEVMLLVETGRLALLLVSVSVQTD